VADLTEMTAGAFAKDGPVAKAMAARGRKYSFLEPQADYAGRVARTFATPPGERGMVALLDAETGIGKSLGYLVPLGLAIAAGKVRGVISTFTLLLQRQILEEDFPVAADAVRAITGRVLRAAPRLGLRNFISPSRAIEMKHAMAAEGRLVRAAGDALDSLASDTLGDGTIRAWTERCGPLPPGVREADICLVGSDGEDGEAFRTHISAASEADIVVVTHALLARSMLRWNSVILGLGKDEAPPFALGVVDEADRLPRVAADVFSLKVSIPMLRSAAAAVPGVAGRDLRRAIEDASAWFERLRTDNPGSIRRHAQGDSVNLGEWSVTAMREDASKQAGLLAAALARAGAGKQLPADDASVLHQMAVELNQFSDSCEDMSDNQVPALRWSPVRSYAGFSVVPLKPGRLCSRLWNPRPDAPPFLRNLVMTSATLDAPGSPRPFFQFRNDIGLLGDNFADSISGRFAPRRFGKLSFVLADPAVPAPTWRPSGDGDGESSGLSDPAWLDYAASGIAEAASRGGRCLVLATSFRDTESLCALLRARGLAPLEHLRGGRLGDMLDAFRKAPAGILVSPAAWEGVNLPGLLSHLVIPRIPFAPLDTAERQALLDSLIAKGWDFKRAEGSLFMSSLYDAQRRFRQGLGRAIRTATDDVTAWILDPRFPLPLEVLRREGLSPESRAMQGFEACIPDRFRTGMRASFQVAEVFRVAVQPGKADAPASA